MARWKYEVTQLDGTTLGELTNVKGRGVSVPLNGGRSGRFTIRQDNRLADFLLNGDARVKVTDPTNTLMAHGPLISAEEVVSDEAKSIACTCAGGPMWGMAKRLVGKSQQGYTKGTALAPIDRGAIVSDMLSVLNTEAETGLQTGTIETTNNTYVGPWYYKPFSECLAELSTTLNGFDWEEVPIAYAGGKFGTLNIYAAKGAFKPLAAFDYGDGRHNVTSYTRAISNEGLMNFGYSLPPGFPDNATQAVLTQSDATSIAARQRYEGVVPGDLVVDTLRQALVDEHVRLRKVPRQIINFVPSRDTNGKRVPQYGTDYVVGDTVPFRAKLLRGGQRVTRIDVVMRVYGVDFAIDDFGTTTTTVTLAAS